MLHHVQWASNSYQKKNLAHNDSLCLEKHIRVLTQTRDLIHRTLNPWKFPDLERERWGGREEDLMPCLCLSVDGSFAKCRIWDWMLPFPSVSPSLTSRPCIPFESAAWKESCSCLPAITAIIIQASFARCFGLQFRRFSSFHSFYHPFPSITRLLWRVLIPYLFP